MNVARCKGINEYIAIPRQGALTGNWWGAVNWSASIQFEPIKGNTAVYFLAIGVLIGTCVALGADVGRGISIGKH